MGNRCSSCNKFVGLEIGEPEVNNLEVDQTTGEVTAEVRLSLNCIECSDELRENTFYLAADPDGLAARIEELNEAGIEFDLEVEEGDSEATEDYETTDTRRLKDGTVKVRRIPFRFQKHFYGVTVHATVTLTPETEGAETESFDVELSDQEQASSFEDLW